MSKKYHLSLKGYVGDVDFDRANVDRVLEENEGKHVDVIIDSLGGSLAAGLSILSSFKQHGDVSVHFVGLNASAATIASLGAKHISMDAASGMYLVHKCSTAFFQWASLNADQFETLISDCTKIKEDLDKLDLQIANLYAKKCKKPVDDLIKLMKRGGWLSASEAFEWGFVDELVEDDESTEAVLTDAVASAMAAAGIPIPNIPISASSAQESFMAKLIQSVSAFFAPAHKPKVEDPNNSQTQISNPMNKNYSCICAALGLESLALSDDKATLEDAQLLKLEAAVKEKTDRVEALEAEVSDLKAKLDKKPADNSTPVVEDSKQSKTDDTDDLSAFADSYNSAKALFDSLP